MQFFLGIEVDTTTMTTEELERVRNTIRGILANINHQITIGYLANHRYSANNDLDELVNDRNNIQAMLSNIEHQIVTRKIKHKHPYK